MASNDFLIICGMCGEAQHESCVVYNPKIQGGLPYLCSSCWTFNDLILCRATLIIVPDYCLELWIQDVTFSFNYILFMKINTVILISDTENN